MTRSLHAPSHVARLVLGTVAAVALLSAMHAVAAAEPVGSDQFAPGWEAHAKPLYLQGPMSMSGRDEWYLPSVLPKGEYVLVHRRGDKVELVQGVRIQVNPGNVDQYVFLDPGMGDVEALPLADVPSLKASRGAAALR